MYFNMLWPSIIAPLTPLIPPHPLISPTAKIYNTNAIGESKLVIFLCQHSD